MYRFFQYPINQSDIGEKKNNKIGNTKIDWFNIAIFIVLIIGSILLLFFAYYK